MTHGAIRLAAALLLAIFSPALLAAQSGEELIEIHCENRFEGPPEALPPRELWSRCRLEAAITTGLSRADDSVPLQYFQLLIRKETFRGSESELFEAIRNSEQCQSLPLSRSNAGEQGLVSLRVNRGFIRGGGDAECQVIDSGVTERSVIFLDPKAPERKEGFHSRTSYRFDATWRCTPLPKDWGPLPVPEPGCNSLD